MEIIKINTYTDIPKLTKKLSVTMGEFDGVHLAHQELFKKTIEFSKKDQTLSAVITFNPHPDQLLKPNNLYESIFSLNEKIEEIKKYNFDYLFIINFDNVVLKMNHLEFVNKYLKPLNIKNLIVGFDFKYGYKGLGNYYTIKEELENVYVTEEMKYNGQTISSTYIKQLLKEGKIDSINYLLNKPFKLTGKVIYGKQIGSTLNIPTANLLLENNYPSLKLGVYVVECIIGNKKYPGIMNVGHNPTFNYTSRLSYEVHIIDDQFKMNLYDQKITVNLVKYLREEKKFESIEEFKKQIAFDKKEAFLALNIDL